ncbi:MAG: hypothetical protein M5U28_44880 [Sandaracinaceae bacterium]|nr:hypothetical protein [Sandaracinaceae bacterium]
MTAVLDALTRAAQGLTDRYRIPAGPVTRGEHRLPPPVGTVEVPFREWVLARIETGLAPRLLTSTREVAAKVEPLAQALSELERRVAFNVELGTSELSILEDDSVPAQTKKLLREMLVGALDRNRELFHGYAQASEKWGEEVRSAIRDAVLSGLEDLRTGIVDGEVGRLRSQMVRDVRSRRVLRFFKEAPRRARAQRLHRPSRRARGHRRDAPRSAARPARAPPCGWPRRTSASAPSRCRSPPPPSPWSTGASSPRRRSRPATSSPGATRSCAAR